MGLNCWKWSWTSRTKRPVANLTNENTSQSKPEEIEIASQGNGSTAPMPAFGSTDASFMCLRCRGLGHVLADCSTLMKASSPPFQPILPSMSKAISVRHSQRQHLCKTCKKIGLTWDAVADAHGWNVLNQKDRRCANLGPIENAIFRKDCSLCVLLFDVTPDPGDRSNLELFVVMAFTLNRFGYSKYTPTVLERDDMQWAECLYTALDDRSQRESVCSVAPNGICHIGNDGAKNAKILAGRAVPNDGVNIDLVKSWITRCVRQHGTRCESHQSSDLRQIRLVDVQTRTIVTFPDGEHVKYVALSYTWGTTPQKDYNVGDVLSDLPRTIVDAMEFTKRLGTRYFWCDSLCIDQSNVHKQLQISLMGTIYGGAWVTIVALSGIHADFGLCRADPNAVSSSHAKDEKFHLARSSQVLRTINGEPYGTTLPSLDQQVRSSRWRYRAWTLQEALLSPRCLCFTCDQVYFQCNIIQCCESIDDTRNPAFPLDGDPPAFDTPSDSQEGERSIMEDYPAGTLINPFSLPENQSDEKTNADVILFDQLRLYDRLLEQYSGRELSYDSDMINAFSALLEKFQQQSHTGTLWGLPAAALPWTMLWEEESYCNRRIPEFPSWSWAGWQGTLSIGQYSVARPGNIYTVDNPEPMLSIWKIETGKPVELFILPEPNPESYELRNSKWLLTDLSRLPPRTDDIDLKLFPDTEKNGLLLIDGIILTTTLEWYPPRRGRHGEPKWEYHTHMKTLFGNIKSPRLPPEQDQLGKLKDMVNKPQDLLVVFAKDIGDHPAERTPAIFMSLLLLRWDGPIARRVAVIYMRLDGQLKEDISKCKPERRRFMLG